MNKEHLAFFMVITGFGLMSYGFYIDYLNPNPKPIVTEEIQLSFVYPKGIWITKAGKYTLVIYNDEPEIMFSSLSLNEAIKYALKGSENIVLVSTGIYQFELGVIHLNKTLHLGTRQSFIGANFTIPIELSPVIHASTNATNIQISGCTVQVLSIDNGGVGTQ